MAIEWTEAIVDEQPSEEDLAQYAALDRIIAEYDAQVSALRELYGQEIGTDVIKLAYRDGLITQHEYSALFEFLTGWQ